jgi:beta-barrel assembly-enhancing protease
VRLIAIALLAATLTGCAAIQSVNILSTEDELSLGQQFDAEISKEAEFLEDPDIVAYVNDLTQRLAKVCKRTEVEYRVRVVVSEDINAFAVPGGYLYVNLGLIRAAKSESELAGVMGHEIGHVVGRHGAKHMTQRLGLAAMVGVIAGDDPGLTKEIIGGLVAVGGHGLLLKYGRDDELEADALGIQNLHDAGIDPSGLVTFFDELLNQEGGGDAGFMQMLSTHPPTKQRIQRGKDQVNALPDRPGLQNASARFRRIQRSLPAPKEPTPQQGAARPAGGDEPSAAVRVIVQGGQTATEPGSLRNPPGKPWSDDANGG